MEVRDVFAMRKEGKVDEAYQAISKIYAGHHGPYTNLCMFWCSCDKLKKSAKEKDTDTVHRMLGAMVKLYPTINDADCRAARAVSKGALIMDKMKENFNLIYFLPWFEKLNSNEDWAPYTVNDHRVPSLGQQIVNHLLRDVPHRDADYLNKVIPLFRKAIEKAPHNKDNQRHYAQIESYLGNDDKAIAAYKRILQRYHDSYLYADLSQLVSDKTQKIALLCQAVLNQHKEKFSSTYHLQLAQLFKDTLSHNAAYEIGECIAIRRKYQYHLTSDIESLAAALKGVTPTSEADERALYGRSKSVVDALLRG